MGEKSRVLPLRSARWVFLVERVPRVCRSRTYTCRTGENPGGSCFSRQIRFRVFSMIYPLNFSGHVFTLKKFYITASLRGAQGSPLRARDDSSCFAGNHPASAAIRLWSMLIESVLTSGRAPSVRVPNYLREHRFCTLQLPVTTPPSLRTGSARKFAGKTRGKYLMLLIQRRPAILPLSESLKQCIRRLVTCD